MKNSKDGFLVDKALALAAKAHQGQFRKGTDIPYISHPYAVGLILQGVGCREKVVAAGILHDLLEDTGITLDQLQEEFGPEVAGIVEGCSEPEHDDFPWEARKEHTIAYLKSAPVEIRMVACADKLHNLRSMLVDYRLVGEALWDRFKRGKEKQEWYYRRLAASLGSNPGPRELEKILRQYEAVMEEVFGVGIRD